MCVRVSICVKILTKISILLSFLQLLGNAKLAFYPRPMYTNDCYYLFCVYFFLHTLGSFERERERENEHYYIAVKVNKFICTQHSITFECFSVLFVISTHWVLEWKKYGVCCDVCMHWCEEKPNWDNIVNRNVCLTRKIMCA